MLPDSNFLFSQGDLESELAGRRSRLRQAAKDLRADDLAAGDAPVVDRLVARFDLREVTVRTDEAEVVATDDGPRLRIPFTGSGVLLHRSSPAAAGTAPFLGRVVERSRTVDGERIRRSWVEVAVPTEPAAGQPPAADWQVEVLTELVRRVATTNGHLAEFRQVLRAAAQEAVRSRRARLGRAAEQATSARSGADDGAPATVTTRPADPGNS